MEQVDLRRYEATGVLGIGADYEARAAVERDTGRQVVLKRPAPETVRHRMHDGTEVRTDRILQGTRRWAYHPDRRAHCGLHGAGQS